MTQNMLVANNISNSIRHFNFKRKILFRYFPNKFTFHKYLILNFKISSKFKGFLDFYGPLDAAGFENASQGYCITQGFPQGVACTLAGALGIFTSHLKDHDDNNEVVFFTIEVLAINKPF